MSAQYRLVGLISVAVFAWIAGCTQKANMQRVESGQGQTGEIIDLAGQWTLRQAGTQDAIPATVPGCNYMDLIAANRIEDPFLGMNELDSLWVGDVDWEYERQFWVSPAFLLKGGKQLICDGLDTLAHIEINGHPVGDTDNMFRQYRFDVGSCLRLGLNTIRIRFDSPVRYGRQYRMQMPYELPGSEYSWGTGRTKKVYRPYVRKAQYQFGWDWGPCLISSGIWKGIRLVGSDAPSIEAVTTRQVHSPDSVRVTVTAHLNSPKPTTGCLEIAIGDQRAFYNTDLPEGDATLTAWLDIDNPRLWWPRGHGEQNMYPLVVRWQEKDSGTVVTAEDRIGLRTVELVRESDAVGETFTLRVNGRDVFCRGANWIPPDPFPTRIPGDVYEWLIRAAADANMNMIRVWGGGVYESEQFYDLCDDSGIMVWQDLMFACAAYPSDDAFLANVDAEVRQQVKRLGNHPSIMLWCGNNEDEGAILHWYGQEMKEKLWPGYQKLTNDVCAVAVQEEDPDRPWWPSSPSSGEGHDPNDLNRGDQHFWEVWHNGKPFERYREVIPRFCSEFGFQSFPHLQTLQGAIGDEETDITSPLMRQHQRHGRGNTIIAETLARYFWQPENLDDLCYLSQISHGMALKWAVEHWRRNKPTCMGTLYWQLHDCWVAASWASIDYQLRYKAAQYMAKRFFNPLLGTLVHEEEAVSVWITSDIPEDIEGTWTVQAWTPAGQKVNEISGQFQLPSQESREIKAIEVNELFDDSIPDSKRIVRLVVQCGMRHHENLLTFVPFKDLELEEPTLAIQSGNSSLTLSTDVVALFVEVAPGPAELEDNYFHLFPGETRTLNRVMTQPVPDRIRSRQDSSSDTAIRTLFDTKHP